MEQAVVESTVGGLSRTTADIEVILRGAPHPTREQVGAHLRAILAGRAAEEVLLGVPSGGAGGSQDSDLARATRLACSVVLSSGLDSHPESLLFLAPVDDQDRLGHLLLVPEIRHRVGAVISQAYSETLDLVRRHQVTVERVADALIHHGRLSGEEIESLLRGLVPGREATGDPS